MRKKEREGVYRLLLLFITSHKEIPAVSTISGVNPEVNLTGF